MKKIFSLSLMAIALLISGQVKAETKVAKIGSNEYATLQEAVDSVPRLAKKADATTIELLTNVNLTQPISVYDRNVTIDLKGKTIFGRTTADKNCDYQKVVFFLISGTLKMTGGGKVTATDSKGEGVRIFGSANPKAENYSNLIIDAGVTVRGQKAIQVYTWGGGYYYAEKDYPSIVNLYEETKDAKDKLLTSATSNYTNTWFGGLLESERTELANASNKKQTWCFAGSNYGYAFGVTISVSGKLEGKEYAIQTSGVLRSSPKTSPDSVFAKAKYPIITINEGATVQGLSNSGSQYDGSYPTGIYAAGYAYWKVYGNVSGDNGIVAKSGDIVVDGNANISASGAFVGSESSTVTNTSGTKGSGNAIDIVSDNAYSGNMTVKIGGSAQLTSQNGYALLEEIAIKSDSVNKTTGVNIEGGTFFSDSKSAVLTTEGVKNQIVAEGTITGGTYSSNDISTYLPAISGLITIEVSKETGEPVYVIGGSKTPVTWKNENINTVADGSYVQYKEADVDYTLTKNVNIAYLSMADKDNTAKITIPDGKTLRVGEIVMGELAQIVVEAGGKLIVESQNGVVAFETSNLVIKATSTDAGVFVMNPAVKSNTNPYATVEYWDKAGKLEGGYYWSMFANPFASVDTIYTDANDDLYIQWIDVAGNMWRNFPGGRKEFIATAKPFQMYSTTNENNFNTGHKIVMKGKLQGNVACKFMLNKGYNYIGNGYLANMDATQMIQELAKASSKVNPIFYTYDVKSGFTAHNAYAAYTGGPLKGMAGFILYANEDVEITLDYEKLIWNQYK